MRRIPVPVVVLLLADVALIALPVVDHALGSPYNRLRNFFSLDSEMSLPAWYSSMQWFVAGCLYGVLFIYAYRARLRGMIAVGLFASLCVVFSLDEIAWIHEWIGQKLDALLPGGDRANTLLSRTGPWPILIGIPVLMVLAAILVRARSLFFPVAPRAFRLLTIGLVVMFTGALVIELMVNALEPPEVYGGIHLLQHATEEFLEMLGVTIIVWSGIEILQAYGVELRIPAATPARRELRDPDALTGIEHLA